MSDVDRYSRQTLFPPLGPEGQRLLCASRAAVVGVGALGCQEAALLARAGVGHLDLIDRDVVEISNLQRQILFEERHAHDGLPKALAAAEVLRRANSTVRIEAHVRDLDPGNVRALLGAADVVVDGTDNLETRYLVNDFCVREGIPWIYAAAVGATGLLLPVLPGRTPCLRCLFETPPPPGSLPTCDTAGVLAPATSAVGALAAAEAIKVLSGRLEAVRRGLWQIDVWNNETREIRAPEPRSDCPCCARRSFPFLEGAGRRDVALCGRDAVQIRAKRGTRADLGQVRRRLGDRVGVREGPGFLRFEAEGHEITLFDDGRALVRGTSDPARARSLYARWIGI